jgi:hypothetical protein
MWRWNVRRAAHSNATSCPRVPTDGGLKTETEDAVDRVMARIYQACGFSPTEFGIQSGASANRSAHHNVKVCVGVCVRVCATNALSRLQAT